MYKTIFSICLSLTLLTPALKADDKAEAPKGPSKFLLKTGGVIVEPIEGKPGIKLLDAQPAATGGLLAELGPEMQKLYRIPVRLDKSDAASDNWILTAGKAAADPEVVALVLICEDPNLPALLVAPEGKWAIVNVAALASDKPAAELLQSRISKEIWRATTHVLGAANSEFPVCLMKPVFNLTDLDALRAEMICFEPLAGVRQQLAAMNVEMLRQTSYRKAVIEGWAPPPANEIQQGVWDEIKGEKKAEEAAQ